MKTRIYLWMFGILFSFSLMSEEIISDTFIEAHAKKAIAEQATLVNVSRINPNIIVDLKYATSDNFTGQVIYSFKECYLVPQAAHALSEAANLALTLGYQLKVFDCFRPMSAQEKFWEICPDPRYVADPKTGGRHTRGTAVDLTLVKYGQELPMPSAFDSFTEKAHRTYKEATLEEITNSLILTGLLAPYFDGLATEWWHFDLKDYQNYPPLLNVEIPSTIPH